MNDISQCEQVTASVVLDEYDVVKPFDKKSKQELKSIAKEQQLCFVRDIDAHETIPIKFVNGRWKKVAQPDLARSC